MATHYLPPGAPPPTPPASQPNSYLQPSSPPPMATPPKPEPAPSPGPAHDPYHVLLAEWRVHHGSGWISVSDLSTTILQMIDERGRIPAVRQRLRQLVATRRELEAKTTGNRAKRVVLYRLIETETAGLEG